jgi:predicted dehydrogenase
VEAGHLSAGSQPRYNLTMRKLKLGVVGCGVIGPHHMKGAQASTTIDLVAVADRIEERARAKAAEFVARKVFREGIDLIRDPEIEAVVLAFPAGERAALACEAFRLGKHVLLEKPGAARAAEIEKMISLQGDRVGACCSARYKFAPSFEAARDCVASGALGDLREIYGRNLLAAGKVSADPPPPWRASRAQNGGGILVNWSPYDFDYLLSVAGWSVKPESVFAQTWPVAPHLAARVDPASDAENHYVALIRCRGGAVIHIERGEFTSLRNETVWQIIGSRASLRLHMTLQESKQIWIDETDAATGVTSRLLWEGTEASDPVYYGPVQDFADAVLGRRAPKTDLRQALVIQRIFDAIYASAASGRLAAIE